MTRILGFIALAAIVVLLPSCATEDPNLVDTKPWNRPEKWEGQGPLGGMINQ